MLKSQFSTCKQTTYIILISLISQFACFLLHFDQKCFACYNNGNIIYVMCTNYQKSVTDFCLNRKFIDYRLLDVNYLFTHVPAYLQYYECC